MLKLHSPSFKFGTIDPKSIEINRTIDGPTHVRGTGKWDVQPTEVDGVFGRDGTLFDLGHYPPGEDNFHPLVETTKSRPNPVMGDDARAVSDIVKNG